MSVDVPLLAIALGAWLASAVVIAAVLARAEVVVESESESEVEREQPETEEPTTMSQQRRRESTARLPEADEVRVCPYCGRRILYFRFPSGGVWWDPDRLQRRWVRSLMSVRDNADAPPWSDVFGRSHECPAVDEMLAGDVRDEEVNS